MENRIYQMKDKLLTKIEEEMQDMSRLDVKEVGELINAVHHLAETEYYCSISDAMWADKHGYSGAPVTDMRRDYTTMPMRAGYTMPSRGTGTMGHDDIIEKLGHEYNMLSPEEKMMMKSKVLNKLM